MQCCIAKNIFASSTHPDPFFRGLAMLLRLREAAVPEEHRGQAWAPRTDYEAEFLRHHNERIGSLIRKGAGQWDDDLSFLMNFGWFPELRSMRSVEVSDKFGKYYNRLLKLRVNRGVMDELRKYDYMPR
jgi:hypothetical protein